MSAAVSYCWNNPHRIAATAVLLGVAYPAIRFRRWRAEASRRLEDLKVQTTGLAEGALPLTRLVRVKPTTRTGRGGSAAALGGGGDDFLDDAVGGNRVGGSLHRAAASLDLRDGYAQEMSLRGRNGDGDGDRNRSSLGICSLSDYLSSLRPAPSLATTLRTRLTAGGDEGAARIRDEIDALLAYALLQVLGPRFGAAALPILGRFPQLGNNLEASIARASQRYRRREAAAAEDATDGDRVLEDDRSLSTEILSALSSAVDAGRGLSLLVLGACSDSAAMIESSTRKRDDGRDGGPREEPDAMSIMRAGEKVDEALAFPPSLLTSPFVVDAKWNDCVAHAMQRERELYEAKGEGEAYDPDAYPVDIPKPLDRPLLPDLFLGFGGARGTHTHRQVIQSRLLAVLLNKLGANDAGDKLSEDEMNRRERFVVKINVGGEERSVDRPCQFVKALMDAGHEVSAGPRLNVVSFGMGLCIKEEEEENDTGDSSRNEASTSNASRDGSALKSARGTKWTNIPIGVVLRSGYEDSTGRPAHAMLTHGGLDLDVSAGPILGGTPCAVQHYHAIDGFCGWYANHNKDVPWLRDDIKLGDRFVGPDAIRAVRLAGLVAVTLNEVATRLNFPHGGYGLTGVCLDSTSVVEMAMKGETSVYPNLSVGRFYAHAIRNARTVRSRLKVDPATDPTVASDMDAVVDAMLRLPNDVASSPSGAADAARRMLRCMPSSMPFKVLEESRDVLMRILEEGITKAS